MKPKNLDHVLIVLGIIICLAILLSGCNTKTSRKYFPPTKETRIEVKDESGAVVEVHGPVSEETTESGFTLGTQGEGSYRLFDVNGLKQ